MSRSRSMRRVQGLFAILLTAVAVPAAGQETPLHTRIDELVAELTPHYGEDCPVAVVAHASQPTEVVLRGTLGDIAGQVHDAGIKRTAVIVVGRVLAAEGFCDSHLYSPSRVRTQS